MARLLAASNQKAPGDRIDVAVEHQADDVALRHRSSGLPELPPTMSLLVEMQKGVRMSSWSLTFIQLSGILKGEEPVARSKARSR